MTGVGHHPRPGVGQGGLLRGSLHIVVASRSSQCVSVNGVLLFVLVSQRRSRQAQATMVHTTRACGVL
jgi:hypothetical protein